VQPEVTQTWDLLHTLNSEEEERWGYNETRKNLWNLSGLGLSSLL